MGIKFLPLPATQIRVKNTTFLENTRDVLQCLDQINYISDNALLVSLGGVNLYPDIPKECRKYAVFPWKTWRPIGVTWKSLKTSKCSTIKHNYFESGKDVFHQILGTAIETKFASSMYIEGLRTKLSFFFNCVSREQQQQQQKIKPGFLVFIKTCWLFLYWNIQKMSRWQNFDPPRRSCLTWQT